MIAGARGRLLRVRLPLARCGRTTSRPAANLLVFFTLPFALLLATVARADFPDSVPRALAAAALALATLFALVGLWQAATHELFFYAPNLAVSNANTDFFRVTSLFGDPSLYGRHLVLGIGVALSLLAAQRWKPWPLIGLLVVMWAGLFFSYSQSSFAALLVVTLALAVITGDRRVRLTVGVLALLAVLAGAGYATVQLIDGESLNKITSDRTERVEDTLRVIEDRPFTGVGIGGQARASRDLASSDRPTPNFVSHTTPLTVFAELGVIGLALYVWLLAGGAILIAAVLERDRALGLALLGLVPRAVRARALLQRLPRRPDHLVRPGRGRRLPRLARGPRPAAVGGGAARASDADARRGDDERPRRLGPHRGPLRADRDHAAGARLGPLALPAGHGRPAGPTRSARARRGRGVGRGHRARGRVRRRAPVRRGGGAADRAAAPVAALGRHRARADAWACC